MLSRTTVGLLLVAGLALALRVGVTLAVSSTHSAPVTYEHGEIAENLIRGRGFTVRFLGAEGPTSQQSPLYPVMLAASYAVFGIASPAAILAMQLLQCLAGTAIVLCVAWLSWSLLPRSPEVGWVAALGAAMYPPHVYMVTHIQTVTWITLSLTLLTAIACSARLQRRWAGSLLSGACAGVAILLEPIVVLALPFVALLAWRSSSADVLPGLKGRFARLAMSGAVAAALVSPWIVRNYQVHGEFVFVKSTFGYALWQGNNPSSWGTDKIPKPSVEQLRNDHDGTWAGRDRAMWEARHETLYIDDVLLTATDYATLARLTEPQRSRLLGARAWRHIRGAPKHYAALCWQRLRYVLLFDETNPKTASVVYRLSTLCWLGLTCAGIVALRRHWRMLWPLGGAFAAIVLFHTLTIASARFRIPIEPLSFLASAAGLLWIGNGVACMAGNLRRHCRLNASNDQALQTADLSVA